MPRFQLLKALLLSSSSSASNPSFTSSHTEMFLKGPHLPKKVLIHSKKAQIKKITFIMRLVEATWVMFPKEFTAKISQFVGNVRKNNFSPNSRHTKKPPYCK